MEAILRGGGETHAWMVRNGFGSLQVGMAGRPGPTMNSGRKARQCIGRKRSRFGLAPSSPRRFFLSASYSW